MTNWRLCVVRIPCLIIVAALFVSCGDPLAVIPGGELSGQTQTPPPAWTDVPRIIQVETRPSDPYSINIWSVGIDSDLYIATGNDGTTWSEFINTNSKVRARIGSSLYKLNATSVNDPQERNVVIDAYLSKYGDLDSEDNWVKTGLIFRLDRR